MRTLVFMPSAVGAMEDSEQRRNVTSLRCPLATVGGQSRDNMGGCQETKQEAGPSE